MKPLIVCVVVSGAGLLIAFLLMNQGDGMTPLLRSAHSGNADEKKRLIDQGPEIDEQSRYGWTALMFAASQGHEESVVTLLGAGADPNIVSDPIPSGFMATRGGYSPTTALQEAIQNEHFDIANILLDNGASADPVAFALAGGTGNIPLLVRFIKLGGNINQPGDNEFHRSPLCDAAGGGKLEAVQWLISHGANPNLIAVHQTALGEAVRHDQVDVVECLLENESNPNLVFGSMNDSALYVAATKHTDKRDYDKNLAIIRLLLSHGADREHKAYGDRTVLTTCKIQRNNGLKDIQKTLDPKIKKRHEDSLNHKDAVIDLLQHNQGEQDGGGKVLPSASLRLSPTSP